MVYFKNAIKDLFEIQNGGEIQDGRQTKSNAPDFSKMMQIICNIGFWKIKLFKKYHKTIFFSNYKMAEAYKMAPTTTIFAFGPQLLYISIDFQNKTCFGIL
jgi:hypothetical protein